MGEVWVKEAERWGRGSIGGDMDSPGRPPRAVWHTTESGNGSDATFKAVADYLVRIGAEPHFLYDPVTDRLAQFGPLTESARALKNDGGTRTNRTGRVCIQVEVMARAAKPFTSYWRPGKNFRAMMRAIRSHGVPDVWPAGKLAAQYGDGHRPRDVWLTRGGHYGHSNVPGNDHWDPGAIDKAALFKAAPTGSGGAHAGPSKVRQVTVKAGQTLGKIAASAGLTLAALLALNPQVKDPDVVHPGDRITVPAESKPTTPAKPKPSTPAKPKPPAYPGASKFRPGAVNQYVTQLGEALVRKGYGRYYALGPGPRWTESDRKAVAAYQRAQGWTGTGADGYPGPKTWERLMR
ncbi:endolysin [Streptomyces phage Attoomi]|uniref:LysM-like endolysin n=1 Tax=Streptomyces phage Attoomi TaxID=2059881 RepID=A0A2H5BLG5_9CAUD|nr:endolysin [Streptomyces phage Attoomi]AUG87152.1 LysM-like endolysin [Streptomyces phage Attoomi]